MSTSRDEDASSDVFLEEGSQQQPVLIRQSGAGGIAALIKTTRNTGQLKDISKKDQLSTSCPRQPMQRVFSVPDQFAQPKESSKVTARSLSVSPSNRTIKCSSVIVLPTNRETSPPLNGTNDQLSPKSTVSQSSGISSLGLEDTSTFDEPTNEIESSPKEVQLQDDSPKSSKPVPRPRLSRAATSDDLPVTKDPPVEVLKYEKEVLKHQINHLKEQKSELELQNKVLRDHLQSSDEFDSPSTSPQLKAKLSPEHAPETSKPVPVPRQRQSRSCTVSLGSGVQKASPRQPFRKGSLQDDVFTDSSKPESPISKPRSMSRPIIPPISETPQTNSQEKAKAVKTLQALLPVVTKTESGQKKAELRGPDGLTRTERSLLQMQELLEPEDKQDGTKQEEKSKGSRPSSTVVDQPKSSRPSSTVVDQPKGSRPSSTIVDQPKGSRPSSTVVDQPKGSRPSSTVVDQPKGSRPSSTVVDQPKGSRPSSTVVNQPKGSRPSSTVVDQPKGSRPSSTVIDQPKGSRPSSTVVDQPKGSRPSSTVVDQPKSSKISKPSNSDPPASSKNVSTKSSPTSIPIAKSRTSIPQTRPSATQGAPSTNDVKTSDTNKRDSQTPPTSSRSVSPPRPPLPDQLKKSPGVTQKKTPIKSDMSWIKRRESIESYDSKSTISPSQTMPNLTPPPKDVSPTPPHRPLPYRSHAIISTAPPSSGSAYVPPPTLVVEPPKVGRGRTESVATKNKVVEVTKDKKRRHSFTRSTSDDSISSKPGSKGKGGVKGQLSPPKKPPRFRKTPSDSVTFRPTSMIEWGNEMEKPSGDFTSSCMVSTAPRGIDPAEEMRKQKTPKKGKRSASETSESPPGAKKRGLLSRFKSKTQYKVEAPPLQEEPEDGNGTESSSDDEKGGTIKSMPRRLRHVSTKPRAASMDQDDSEPEYHQLFEYVFVVGLQDKGKGTLATEITYTFPPAPEHLFSGKDAALLAIPQFCFPDIDQWKPTKSYKSESFSFVLTDIEGGRRFGYCRRLLPSGKGARLPEVYCIVSPLGCFSLYEEILDQVEERRAKSSSAVFTFLKAIQANPFPRPGRSVEVRAFAANGSGLETVVLGRPMDSRLEHVNFSLLFSTLSQRKVIQLFSSLLMERRVILCAHSLSLLSGCAHALLALLYPFEWQHVFIPVLPSSLIEFVCSPLPYIIGINPSTVKQLDTMEMEEVVLIDLEKKKFILKVGDETSILPSKLFQYLEHSLSSPILTSEYLKKSPSQRAPMGRADEIVVNTFMTFFAYLYGDYKSYMKGASSSGERLFQRKDFVKKFSSKSTKRFLEAFHMTQMFENFIEQRENPNKAETTAQSYFERQLPELQDRCQEIEIFSSKSRFDRWKLAKGMKSKK